ncbi:MAG: gliding motility protein GldO [Vicingaceae bacterium]|nr:MAG: gliding motility protein GldO [Vicingaceae bacterium]
MKILKQTTFRYALVLLTLVSGTFSYTQNTPNILDGVYVKEHTPTRKVISYPHLREADVMWAMRVWRVLDMKEKMNHPLYYPIEPINNRKSLFDVIKIGIEEGTITAYGNPAIDDEFKTPLTKAEAKALLAEYQKIFREDLNTGELFEDSTLVEVTSRDIKRYWIKEDWFFDKQRSVLDVRIIGIAPLREKLEDDGVTVRGYLPMFWIYFPEARYVFANYDVFNRFNDAERRTFEDIFWKRIFSSYIRKVSNVYERYFVSYLTPWEQMLESEKVKEDIFVFEHDLWEF